MLCSLPKATLMQRLRRLMSVSVNALCLGAVCALTVATVTSEEGATMARRFITTTVATSVALCLGPGMATTTMWRFAQPRQITNAFTTGMSASRNYCYTKVQFLMSTCSRLRKASSLANTQLSTRMSSEVYSDL